jgi:hypothetical protein
MMAVSQVLQPELYQISDRTLRYKLHRGQAAAYRSKTRFNFIISGTQSGKTTFIPLWLDREIDITGHGDYLAATATYDLFKLKFLPEMRRYFIDTLGWHEDKSDRVFWREYKPRMFDRIILRSASSEGGLESATIKAAVLDECGQNEFRIEAWEAVQRRLSLSRGRVLGATTPYNLGWLKLEVYDKWRNGDTDYRVIQFRSTDNPAFPLAEYERAKRTLATWKFEMFYNGQFSKPEGLIYNDLSETENIWKPFEIPAEWPRYVGVDFGGVHTATVWIAENKHDKALYIYRETLDGGLTTQEHANKWSRFGERVVHWAGGAVSEDQPRRDFEAAGIPIRRPGIADVEAGIDRVTELIKTRRLIIFNTCRGLLDELGTYSRVIDNTGQPTDKINDKEKFHRLDALRYISPVFGNEIKKVATSGQWI